MILKSCGIADVIASSEGGRNHKCAMEFAKRKMELIKSGNTLNVDSMALWNTIELELLEGQKLQGVVTCDEVIECVDYFSQQKRDGIEEKIQVPLYPLFHRIHNIARKNADPRSLCMWNKEMIN